MVLKGLMAFPGATVFFPKTMVCMVSFRVALVVCDKLLLTSHCEFRHATKQ